ncbi:MAG: CDGSH iron-sulfur domain-containing protein [Acidimicrobiales bacterium]
MNDATREPAMSERPGPTIRVTQDGPYLVEGGLEVRNAEGQLEARDRYALCRCGGSSNKPFCDGTHARIGFDGTETADHGPIARRQDDYVGKGVTIHDDRTVCAHAGFCTDNLAAVFKLGEEPWIDAPAADRDAIVAQVKQCPSGALSVTIDGDLSEDDLPQGVEPVPDGPYRVRGGVQVLASDGTPYEVRNRQTLCRCGGSPNKPFCNGTHWHIGFKAP